GPPAPEEVPAGPPSILATASGSRHPGLAVRGVAGRPSSPPSWRASCRAPARAPPRSIPLPARTSSSGRGPPARRRALLRLRLPPLEPAAPPGGRPLSLDRLHPRPSLTGELVRDRWPTDGHAFGLGLGGLFPYNFEEFREGDHKDRESF